eukprot:2684821-Alexandrium_andersonii.AAC.1
MQRLAAAGANVKPAAGAEAHERLRGARVRCRPGVVRAAREVASPVYAGRSDKWVQPGQRALCRQLHRVRCEVARAAKGGREMSVPVARGDRVHEQAE